MDEVSSGGGPDSRNPRGYNMVNVTPYDALNPSGVPRADRSRHPSGSVVTIDAENSPTKESFSNEREPVDSDTKLRSDCTASPA